MLSLGDGFQDDFLGNLVGARFHHEDGIAGAADHHAQGAVAALLVGWVDDVLTIQVGDTAGSDWAVEGNLGYGQGG